MSRTGFRNLWLVVIGLMLSSAWFVFQKAEREYAQTERQNARLEQLKRERRDAEKLSASLAELDSLTINENEATRLEILRHLGLETQSYGFDIQSRSAKVIGDGTLYTRRVSLKSEVSYAESLKLLDTLHSTKKFLLERVTMRESNGYGDQVVMEIDGIIHGLEKYAKR